MLTGTLASEVKISIADGAIVTLDGININKEWDFDDGTSAGITCAGSATIILAGENTVSGLGCEYPGIYVPSGKTLTIMGTGSLTASSNGSGAGIGGGYDIACGTITISSGTVTATKGSGASASIGAANDEDSYCASVTIEDPSKVTQN